MLSNDVSQKTAHRPLLWPCAKFFRTVKSRFLVMEGKKKPSMELGEIIRLLVIVKLINIILHFLK
jgi:hypothetical protein